MDEQDALGVWLDELGAMAAPKMSSSAIARRQIATAPVVAQVVQEKAIARAQNKPTGPTPGGSFVQQTQDMKNQSFHPMVSRSAIDRLQAKLHGEDYVPQGTAPIAAPAPAPVEQPIPATSYGPGGGGGGGGGGAGPGGDEGGDEGYPEEEGSELDQPTDASAQFYPEASSDEDGGYEEEAQPRRRRRGEEEPDAIDAVMDFMEEKYGGEEEAAEDESAEYEDDEESGFTALGADEIGKGGHGGHGHGGRGRGRGWGGGPWWWSGGPWYDDYYELLEGVDTEAMSADELAELIAKKLKEKGAQVGYVAPSQLQVATPGVQKDEMDKILREGETLDADVQASSADASFKNAWRAFWDGYKKFYDDKSGFTGWFSRLWTATGNEIASYGNQLNDWRAKLKQFGAHITEPDLTDLVARKDPNKVDWKPILIGVGVVTGLAAGGYALSKVVAGASLFKRRA